MNFFNTTNNNAKDNATAMEEGKVCLLDDTNKDRSDDDSEIHRKRNDQDPSFDFMAMVLLLLVTFAVLAHGLMVVIPRSGILSSSSVSESYVIVQEEVPVPSFLPYTGSIPNAP